MYHIFDFEVGIEALNETPPLLKLHHGMYAEAEPNSKQYNLTNEYLNSHLDQPSQSFDAFYLRNSSHSKIPLKSYSQIKPQMLSTFGPISPIQ